MEDIIRNYKGANLTNAKRELRNPKFGKGRDEDGNPIVDWSQLQNADKDGFDITNEEDNGNYIIKDYALPSGTKIIRYGEEYGRYTAPKGTDYNNLSLPYVKETVPYYEYEVVERLRVQVKCVVDRGRVAPGFDSPGGAVQFRHHISIYKSVKAGILKRTYP